jgi:hypothetical protein
MIIFEAEILNILDFDEKKMIINIFRNKSKLPK